MLPVEELSKEGKFPLLGAGYAALKQRDDTPINANRQHKEEQVVQNEELGADAKIAEELEGATTELTRSFLEGRHTGLILDKVD